MGAKKGSEFDNQKIYEEEKQVLIFLRDLQNDCIRLDFQEFDCKECFKYKFGYYQHNDAGSDDEH